jgi:phosphate uptake regulator
LTSYPENSEVRKIQYTGRSTYILSLPKKWIGEMSLKAGDSVTVIREANHSLSIFPTSLRAAASTHEAHSLVAAEDGENTLKRKVVSMYLMGYNVINLKSKSGRIYPAQREAIREVVRRNLVGTEIIGESSDLMTIQVLSSLPELSVKTAVRRMFLIGTSMHNDAMTALSEINNDLAMAVIRSDDEVDRFSLYILRNLVIACQNERILKEIGLKSPADCISYHVAVKSIERIADHATGIAIKSAKIQGKLPDKIFDKVREMSKMSLNILNDSVEAFLRKDYYLADSMVDKSANVRSLEEEIISLVDNQKVKDSDLVNLKLILEDIRRTAERSSDIAEAALNQTISELIEPIK